MEENGKSLRKFFFTQGQVHVELRYWRNSFLSYCYNKRFQAHRRIIQDDHEKEYQNVRMSGEALNDCNLFLDLSLWNVPLTRKLE